LLILGVGAAEVLIMISPFAGLFYAGMHFEPFLGFLSSSPWTAWLDGFFLNHSVVTTSRLLEWQRTIGFYLFTLGLWGFLISASQVYGNKLLGRGVATGLLYRFSRHPQYLALGVAGWGLLTIWPRFLLLGLWVTMLFLYAGLARFEEHGMEERFGDAYRDYARSRGAYLPGSPVHRVFETTFGRMRPRALGWATAYVTCITLVFLAALGLRTFTRVHTVIVERPEDRTMVISAWPQSEEWTSRIAAAAMSDDAVREQLGLAGDGPWVATVLPSEYVMKGMYYKMPPDPEDTPPESGFVAGVKRIARISTMFLVPIEGVTCPENFMGTDPDSSDNPVEVVISRAVKPYKESISVREALDPAVRLTPLVVADVDPSGDGVLGVRVPLPQNRWGPRVVMPLF
jgi:protein-S-isoprenylcysteine O-methyltransferase Ste14